MDELKASAKIPSLQAQMQWMAGTPQTSSTSTSRMLYNFNNANNTLNREPGAMPGVVEANTAQQESTICDPQTGKWVLFFDGNNIYDGYHNLVNPDYKLDTLDHTYLTSIIAPSCSESIPTYYVFYVDRSTKHLNYAIVNFPFGLGGKANWVGTQSLNNDNGVATPFGLACVNENEFWVLTLANANTMVAYKCDTNGVSTTAPVHIMLSPFSSITAAVDCKTSSIVTFGNKIAVTVNNQIMVGELKVSTGFSVINQALVSNSTATLTPDFNASATKLYFLKKLDSAKKNQVWVYEIDSQASYSADSSYVYGYQYLSLKLAPNGTVYGTNLFTSIDPVLTITEIPETGAIEVTEMLNQDINSSATFGNIQYQINALK
ncbi:hypothetical protein QQF54_08370 [Lelliottia sp. V106_10]|uniref:hypothetical protein n=1 Tax=Lelliottia wanjuensis TaxID=3050585 RepID=UPI00254B02CB|nr:MULTISPECIES: hypothetical protein [unclassified Lelliottia]MDK9359054.1 hypothetical protein [Lelliottia sp. V106_16]MDK9373370.1 hypothetical protein [Lelliottia sp. V106_10]MDK9600163.1 hypothetical protein [Lelliottia sp. V106_5]